jgi:hypothetical protein
MRWIAALWARWRTRKARQRAEDEAMYQATVNALAAALSMDATQKALERTVDRAKATQARKRFRVFTSKQVH